MAYYFLNIGSNLGNRKLNLSRALRALEREYGYFETSGIIESSPWGFLSPHRFANIAVMIVTDKSPRQVLESIKGIEKMYNGSPHRNSDGGYCDRELDIDIVAVDSLVVNDPDLKIPHPHLAERSFFLQPMAELAPAWKHPLSGLTCSEMLARLPEEGDDGKADCQEAQ